MGRELEVKFAAGESVQRAILAEYPDFRTIQMETTYFDTSNGALAAQKITLRLRKENGTAVCTLKCPLPDGSKGEWECPAADLSEGLAALARLGAPEAVLALAEKELHPVCGAKFTRRAVDVPTADGLVELAVDSGVLLGGGKEMPLCEVEVELKQGSDWAMLAFADHLAKTYGLHPENQSKFQRAFGLAKGD